MKSWFGSLVPGFGADIVEATVLASDIKLTIGYRDEGHSVRTFEWLITDVEVSSSSSEDYTRVINKKDPGKELKIHAKQAFDFIREQQAEQIKPWHKKNKGKDWIRNSLIFTGFVALLLIAYFLLVPWLSEQLSRTVSVEREAQFGDTIFESLQIREQEISDKSKLVNDFFIEMNPGGPYNIKISVVRGSEVNAFALPGGHIVVYSALLDKLETYPELAALLSHEFIHVKNRHATRSIFRRLGSRIFLSALFGRFGTVTSIMADQADNLKSLNYSRKLEKEADLEGLEILKQRRIDPKGFIDLFGRLQAGNRTGDGPEFLASHPDIEKRIQSILVAGKSPVEENTRLKTIFEKIKN